MSGKDCFFDSGFYSQEPNATQESLPETLVPNTVQSPIAESPTGPAPNLPPPSSSRIADDSVPKSHSHRTLVLCFDGTGDQFDDDNSNVVNFFSLLKKDDPKKQLVYYQAGIGTYTVPQVAKPTMAKFHRLIDMMVGVHLDTHVMEGYEFLMQNYEHGDKVSLFGFSRGAYTARALAGMIYKVGLLPKSNLQQVPFAYKMYARGDDKGWAQSAAFKEAFSIDITIDFMGLWDTVDSVGLFPKRLPYTKHNPGVRSFRHAVALDERRVRFMPTLFHLPTEAQVNKKLKKAEKKRWGRKPQRTGTLLELKRLYDNGEFKHFATDVREVWFAGCHCDVGGGAVQNTVKNSLARIPLRWMIRQCFMLETGILFRKQALANVGLYHATLQQQPLPAPHAAPSRETVEKVLKELKYEIPPGLLDKYQSRGPPEFSDAHDFVNEEEEDLRDLLDTHNDMLDHAWYGKLWWLLEYIPHQAKLKKDGTPRRRLILNRGRGRVLADSKTHDVYLHRTVDLRRDLFRGDKQERYEPRAANYRAVKLDPEVRKVPV